MITERTDTEFPQSREARMRSKSTSKGEDQPISPVAGQPESPKQIATAEAKQAVGVSYVLCAVCQNHWKQGYESTCICHKKSQPSPPAVSEEAEQAGDKPCAACNTKASEMLGEDVCFACDLVTMTFERDQARSLAKSREVDLTAMRFQCDCAAKDRDKFQRQCVELQWVVKQLKKNIGAGDTAICQLQQGNDAMQDEINSLQSHVRHQQGQIECYEKAAATLKSKLDSQWEYLRVCERKHFEQSAETERLKAELAEAYVNNSKEYQRGRDSERSESEWLAGKLHEAQESLKNVQAENERLRAELSAARTPPLIPQGQRFEGFCYMLGDHPFDGYLRANKQGLHDTPCTIYVEKK